MKIAPAGDPSSPTTSRKTYLALAAIVLLHLTISILGINWGLPTRKIDKYLFGHEPPWPGEKIYLLANATNKFAPTRGADVDTNPITRRVIDAQNTTDSSGDVSKQVAPPPPIPLTSTPEDVAKIYLRYRLYTYQPDEMIVMMALAGMNPSQLNFDPRLYQYGGLFIYPVGALIKLCDLIGLIDVRSDVVYYLDNPDEFGKFYIVARAYSAAWGAIGVIVVFAVARRLTGEWHCQITASLCRNPTDAKIPSNLRPSPSGWHGQATAWPWRHSKHANFAGLLAALLFTLMPVVVCMSHEGKPHLPGAVLMLIAVWLAMRCIDCRRAAGFSSHRHLVRTATAWERLVCHCSVSSGRFVARTFYLMCAACGAAVGMVLSSWPICILVPLIAWMCRSKKSVSVHGDAASLGRTMVSDAKPNLQKSQWLFTTTNGALVAIATYLLTNPYIVINIFNNREVLRSNFGNSLAMYQVSRIGEGFLRVIALTIEGATIPIVILGTIAALIAIIRLLGFGTRRRATTPSEPRAQATGSPQPGGISRTAPLSDRRSNVICTVPLLVVACIFLLQFVLIGADKPAEYGRFGVFTNSALAIGASCLMNLVRDKARAWATIVFFGGVAVLFAAFSSYTYLGHFVRDATERGSRSWQARIFDSHLTNQKRIESLRIAVTAEPAPYCCPPLNFGAIDVQLIATPASIDEWLSLDAHATILFKILDDPHQEPLIPYLDSGGFRIHKTSAVVDGFVSPSESFLSPISWADKPILRARVISRERSAAP